MTIHPDRLLAVAPGNPGLRIDGIAVQEPMIGQDGFWILPDQADEARARGFTVAEPLAVMTAHFADITRNEAARLLSRPVFMEMIDGVRRHQPSLVDDLIPTMLTLAECQRVMRNLLSEGVSIANLDFILESLVELARNQRDPDELSEQLRQRIGFVICSKLRGRHRDLAVMSLDPRLENELVGNAGRLPDPRAADKLIRRLMPIAERMFMEGRAPVLLCGIEIRKTIKALTRRAIPRLAVISVNEVPERIDLASYDVVRFEA